MVVLLNRNFIDAFASAKQGAFKHRSFALASGTYFRLAGTLHKFPALLACFFLSHP